MRWLDQSNRYGRNVHVVELTPDENKLSNQQLINLADSGGQNAIDCFNYGGVVEPLEGYQAKITVYTD